MVVPSIKDCRVEREPRRLTPVAAPDKAQARIGRLAQLVERFVYTEDVGGSNPSPPTIGTDWDAVQLGQVVRTGSLPSQSSAASRIPSKMRLRAGVSSAISITVPGCPSCQR